MLGPVDDKCADLNLTGGDANNNDLLHGAHSGAAETWTYTCARSLGLPAGSAGLTVSVAEGEDITCVFTNKATGSGGGSLPDTGLGISWRVLAAGFALILLGGVLLIAADRRRATRT